MAVLAVYALQPEKKSLADFLDQQVFSDVKSTTRKPDPDGVADCRRFIENYRRGLPVEIAAGGAIADQD